MARSSKIGHSEPDSSTLKVVEMPSDVLQQPRVLVADDDAGVREALRLLLRGEGLDVTLASSLPEIASALDRTSFDLLILDLNYAQNSVSGEEGLVLLDRVRALDPGLPILVMTGWATVGGAVDAMQRGAKDYIPKPWDDERLLTSVKTQLALRQAVLRGHRLQEANARLQDVLTPPLIVQAPAMMRVIETVDRIARSDASVLITGEHGTGKEAVARLVHQRSDRASKPFVTMNAGAISAGVAESELFGHVKGAFTDARGERAGVFELADEGTLFLDEVGNMPMGLQPALLRVLQTGELQRVGSSRVVFVNARLVAATNVDLSAAVSRGAFREDLLYRINTVIIHLPPLRDRREDVLPIAAHYLKKFARKYQRPLEGLTADAERALLAHAWPGNVRELTHTIERAVLMSGGPRITAVDLNLSGPPSAQSLTDAMTLEEVERLFIHRVLEKHQGDVRQAAQQLGMSRSALYRRLQQAQT